jgi:hypothetical protein
MATIQEVAAAVDVGRLRRHLEWFAGVPRDTGGPGEDRAAEYIARELRDAGIPCTVHQFEAFMSYPGPAALRVVEPEGQAIPCLTHSFAWPTGPEGVTAELAVPADGALDQAAGCFVLVDGIAAPLTVQQAMKVGCAGVIFVNPERSLHNVIISTIWGTPDLDQRDLLPTVPVVSVNREGGRLLRDLQARGQPVRLHLTTEVQTGWFPSKLPEARIPGTRDETFILVGTHYCSWSVGVTDNATGVACLLELARVLWAHRETLARSIRFCWWPGHSHGRYAGSTWYADSFFTDLSEHCVAYHNIDSPGVEGATELVGRQTTAEMERFCRRIMERVGGPRNPHVQRPSRASDQSFLGNGVPSFSVYTFLPEGHPERRPWSAGSGGAWWWHSEFDTLDKANPDLLTRDARTALEALVELANIEVLPLDFRDSAGEIRGVVRRLQDEAGGHLDLAALLEDVHAFCQAAEVLESTKKVIAPDAAREFNTLLLRVARVLNPVVYTQNGRFHHDGAELLPVRGAVRHPILPGLAKAAMLPKLQGEGDYGFLRAQVIREMNRVRTALQEATTLIGRSVSARP